MEFLFYLLIMHSISLAIATNFSKINVAIGHGLHLQEIQNVIPYQSSVPLLFTAAMPHTTFLNVFYEPHLCKHDKWICNTEKDFSSMDMMKKLDQQTMDLQQEILNHIILHEEHTLQKRNIASELRNVIGEIGSFCCGLATAKSHKQLFKAHNNARDAINENYNSLSSQHSHLVNLTANFRNITEKVNNDFKQVTLQFKQFHADLRDSKEIASASTKFLMHSIVHLYARNYETARQNLRQTILADCKNHFPPTAVIPQKALTHELKNLEMKLKKKGYRLAIPISDVTSYYKKHIAECIISKTDISVRIQIPIIESDTVFTLYNVIAIPQKHKNTTCTLLTKPMTLGISGNKKKIIPITDDIKDYCDHNLHGDNMCLLPQRPQTYYTESHCIINMLRNTKMENIMSVCAFTCYPITETIITTLQNNRFANTHPPTDLQIRCGNTIKKLDQTHHKEPGSLELRLKCACELLSGNNILIGTDFPCPNEEILQNAATHTVPALWTNLDAYQLETSTDPFSTFQLASLNGSYKNDWQNFIPTLNAVLLKPINILLNEKSDIIENQLTSPWILFPSIFIVCALVLFCCILYCFKLAILKKCCDTSSESYEMSEDPRTDGRSTFHVASQKL